MNPRQKILTGYITDFFLDNKAPTWQVLGTALKNYNVNRLFGGEVLPEDFLKVLFNNDEILLMQIPEYGYRHHQLIIMLIKEEYSLTTCPDCGYYSRSIGFNWRRRFQSSHDLDVDWVVIPEKPEMEDSANQQLTDDADRGEVEVCEDENSKLDKCCKYFNPKF